MLKKFTVKCDWPGCENVQEFVCKDRLHDFNWVFRDSVEHGPHLCALHRHKTWGQVKKELKKSMEDCARAR